MADSEIVLDRRLEQLKSNDPAVLQQITQQISINRQSAERWIENIWAVKRYLTKKRSMSGKEADKILGVDDTFDNLEFKRHKTVK
jgi:hypothetical protein